MTLIKQTRPSFALIGDGGFKHEEVEFNTISELLSIGWVKSHQYLPDGSPDPKFIRFSHHPRSSGGAILIAEVSSGIRVVGYTNDGIELKDIPRWDKRV